MSIKKLEEKLVIIIVTYNGVQWIQKCLDSCKGYHVIVVDNASTDDTLAIIKSNYPAVTVLEQDRNLGFGAANNVGMSYALQQNCDYVFLLNQDAYIEPGCIEELMKVHKNNETLGVLSPIHLNGDGTQLDANFSMFLKRYQVNEEILYDSFSNKMKPFYPIDFVNAAAWLIPLKTLQEVGGFDPLFFHYGEDDNYCQRVLFHNYSIGIVTKAVIMHDRGNRKASVIKPNSKKYFEEYERYAKMYWADINLPDFEEKIHHKISYLNKQAFKNLIQFNFKNYKDLTQKKKIFIKLKPQLIKSRNNNTVKNSTYLNL